MRNAQSAFRRGRTRRFARAWVVHRCADWHLCDGARHSTDRGQRTHPGSNPMKLVVGSKNYSSWSLRSWLLLKQAGIAFEEVPLRFTAHAFKQRVLSYSPAGRVLVLIDGELTIWDSLAIAEYVAENFAD